MKFSSKIVVLNEQIAISVEDNFVRINYRIYAVTSIEKLFYTKLLITVTKPTSQRRYEDTRVNILVIELSADLYKIFPN